MSAGTRSRGTLYRGFASNVTCDCWLRASSAREDVSGKGGEVEPQVPVGTARKHPAIVRAPQAVRPYAVVSVIALSRPARGLVAHTAGCGVIAVDLDGALHRELNEVLSLVPETAEHRHDVIYPLGVPLEGLAFGASDHPLGVAGPQRAEAVVVAAGCGIGEAGGRVADSRLVQQASERICGE